MRHKPNQPQPQKYQIIDQVSESENQNQKHSFSNDSYTRPQNLLKKTQTLPANFNSNNNTFLSGKDRPRHYSSHSQGNERDIYRPKIIQVMSESDTSEANENQGQGQNQKNSSKKSKNSKKSKKSNQPKSTSLLCCYITCPTCSLKSTKNSIKSTFNSLRFWILTLLTFLLISTIITIIRHVDSEDFYVLTFDVIQFLVIIFLGYNGMVYCKRKVLAFFIVVQFALFVVHLFLMGYVFWASAREAAAQEAAALKVQEISSISNQPTTNTNATTSTTTSPTQNTLPPFLSKLLTTVEYTEKLSSITNTLFSFLVTILTAVHLRDTHYQQDAINNLRDESDQNEILIDVETVLSKNKDHGQSHNQHQHHQSQHHHQSNYNFINSSNPSNLPSSSSGSDRIDKVVMVKNDSSDGTFNSVGEGSVGGEVEADKSNENYCYSYRVAVVKKYFLGKKNEPKK